MPDVQRLRRPSVLLLAAGAAVLGSLLGGTLYTLAQTSSVPARQIPYEGVLDMDGAPVTTPDGMGLPMVFYLVTAPTGTRQQAIWQEAHPMVPVRGGRFAVALGSVTALPDSVFLNPALYIGVAINGQELSGKQRVLAAPGAVTAAQGQHMNLSGNLNVTGAAAVTGAATVGGLATVGALQVGGSATVGGTTTLNGTTTINGATTLNGTTTLGGRLVGGRAHTGNLQFDGLWGGWTDVGWCPANSYVCGLQVRFEGSQGSGDDTAMNGIQLRCCSIGP